jgi:serine/threonine protein kinase
MEVENSVKVAKHTKDTKDTSHCILVKGDKLSDYTVVKRLGCGRFAAVWSTNNNYAIKVYRDRESKSYRNEVMIFNRLKQFTSKNVVNYIDTFAHISFNSDMSPKIHPCIVFEMAGSTISDLVRHHRKNYQKGLSQSDVKKMLRGIFRGLEHLHNCGVIHADITCGNVLLTCNIDQFYAGYDYEPLIADLGSSSTIDNIYSNSVGTVGYMAPELVIETPFSTPCDIWSAIVVGYRIITGDRLFDIDNECDVQYGEDIDCEFATGDCNDCGDCGDCEIDAQVEGGEEKKEISEENTDSDSSGNSYDEEETNYRFLLLVAKVIGYPHEEFSKVARKYYNRKNRLKNNPDIEPTTLCSLLHSNYDLELNQCEEIAEFLSHGLKYLPDERYTASEYLKHPYLG